VQNYFKNIFLTALECLKADPAPRRCVRAPSAAQKELEMPHGGFSTRRAVFRPSPPVPDGRPAISRAMRAVPRALSLSPSPPASVLRSPAKRRCWTNRARGHECEKQDTTRKLEAMRDFATWTSERATYRGLLRGLNLRCSMNTVWCFNSDRFLWSRAPLRLISVSARI